MVNGLPARWTLRHGAYYYIVPPGREADWDGKRWFRLGKTLNDAYVEWARRIGQPSRQRIVTIHQLLDRYAIQEVPKKALGTQRDQIRMIGNLKAVFGTMYAEDLKPVHVYQYVEARTAKVAARREIEVLSHAFTKSVQWGVMEAHPFKGEVRLEDKPTPRTRYVEDWEVEELLALEPRKRTDALPMLQAYVRLKLLTGLRQRDLLLLTMSDLKDDGIHVTPSKTKNSTGKRVVYAWTPELRSAVDGCIAARRALSPYLICDGKGQCFVDAKTGRANDFNNAWQRLMKRVLSETRVTERFCEHDLRAKVASDADSVERAQELLTHADSKVTERVYRRKAAVIKPAR